MGDRCFGCKSAAGFMVHKVHFSEKLRVTWVEMFKDTLENELVKAQKHASERERMLLFFPTTRTSFFKGHLGSKRCEICMLYFAVFFGGTILCCIPHLRIFQYLHSMSLSTGWWSSFGNELEAGC